MNPYRWMVLALPCRWRDAQPATEPSGDEAHTASPQAVATWLAAFGPDVFVLTQGVAIDGQSVARYWGGWANLWARVVQAWAAHWGEPAVTGQGATVWQAVARLQRGEAANSPIDGLALAALPGVAPHLAMWQSLGLETWGQLRALPRGAVARRWGKDLLTTLDQAYGEAPHCLTPVVVPAHFESQATCSHPVNRVEGLVWPMQTLLQEAVAWLYARGQRALGLVWTLHLDVPHSQVAQGRQAQQVLTIVSAQACSDMGLWWRLMQEHMSRWVLGAPVLAVTLRWDQTQAASEELRGLWDGPAGQSLEVWLDRVKARWGGEHVGIPRWRADHVPERMQAWGAELPGASVMATPPARGLYPPWLLREPLRLLVKANKPWYQGPLRLVLGPQRLDAMPWSATWGDTPPQAVRRDYFVAHSLHGGWLWIYRERASVDDTQALWFLHGVYG